MTKVRTITDIECNYCTIFRIAPIYLNVIFKDATEGILYPLPPTMCQSGQGKKGGHLGKDIYLDMFNYTL